MRRIVIDGSQIEYDPKSDILFVSFGDFDPTLIDHEEGLGDGVYLQYAWPSDELAFMEVWKFSKRYGSLPVTIRVQDEEDYEFVIPAEEPAFA